VTVAKSTNPRNTEIPKTVWFSKIEFNGEKTRSAAIRLEVDTEDNKAAGAIKRAGRLVSATMREQAVCKRFIRIILWLSRFEK